MNIEEVCNKYRNGMGIRPLSKEYGIGEIRMKKLLIQNNITICNERSAGNR